jgi:sugar/nucleoside kinase (ribokinase family)
MTVIAMGVHVVDVLARPITEIPDGRRGQLVEEIRISPAGPAGGTAVTLAKLGEQTRSAGADVTSNSAPIYGGRMRL